MKPLIFLLVLLVPTAVFATIEVYKFPDPAMGERYERLTHELRCLVCQNENLADSNADLAHDLRQEVYEMLKAGKTDKQITAFMVQRYGDFVLYRPPLMRTTLLLWGGPFILLFIAIVVMLRFIRSRGRQAPITISDEDHHMLQGLLNEKDKEK